MSAIFSSCGVFRYRLERDIGMGDRVVAFIMVNPSTADATADDATIRKVKTFASMAGAAKVIVANKFAFRATDVKALRSAADPVGPDNDAHLEQVMRDADLHVVAWGTLGKLPMQLRSRWRAMGHIARRVGCPLHCIGIAQDGHPLHPLMPAYANELRPWRAP